MISWDDAERRERAPRDGRPQAEIDAVLSRIAAPKAIGSDSPEHRDRKMSTSGDYVDWQGYYRAAYREIERREQRNKAEAVTLASWTDSLRREQAELNRLKRRVYLAWGAWCFAVIVMMLVGNSFLGR